MMVRAELRKVPDTLRRQRGRAADGSAMGCEGTRGVRDHPSAFLPSDGRGAALPSTEMGRLWAE